MMLVAVNKYGAFVTKNLTIEKYDYKNKPSMKLIYTATSPAVMVLLVSGFQDVMSST